MIKVKLTRPTKQSKSCTLIQNTIIADSLGSVTIISCEYHRSCSTVPTFCFREFIPFRPLGLRVCDRNHVIRDRVDHTVELCVSRVEPRGYWRSLFRHQDRTLSFKTHHENAAAKLRCTNNVIHKLYGRSWSAWRHLPGLPSGWVLRIR